MFLDVSYCFIPSSQLFLSKSLAGSQPVVRCQLLAVMDKKCILDFSFFFKKVKFVKDLYLGFFGSTITAKHVIAQFFFQVVFSFGPLAFNHHILAGLSSSSSHSGRFSTNQIHFNNRFHIWPLKSIQFTCFISRYFLQYFSLKMIDFFFILGA